MTLIIENKPKLESVSSMMGQLNSYNELLGNKYPNKIQVNVTWDKNDRYDSMINDQGKHVFHIDETKAEKPAEVTWS
jgi:hypothetical protein